MNFDDVCKLFTVKHRTPYNAQAVCRSHEDKIASLSMGVGNDGLLLFHCQAGCTFESVIGAVGLSARDLRPGNGWKVPPPTARREIGWYDYRNEDGGFLYQVVRFEPKDFRQRQMGSDGEWIWSLDGVRRVPYRLPELLAADPVKPIFVVEGEKDVHSLVDRGQVATTNAMGALKWDAEWQDYFIGRRVLIVPDNDEPGRRHAKDVKVKLGKAPIVSKIWKLEGVRDHGDISDYIGAFKGQGDPLAEMLDEMRAAEENFNDYWEEKERARPNSDSALDLYKNPKKKPLVGFLDEKIFTPKNIGAIMGPGGAYKTSLMIHMARSFSTGQNFGSLKTKKARVLFFSEELSQEEMEDKLSNIFNSQDFNEVQHEILFRFEQEFDFFGKVDESVKKMIQAIKEEKADIWILDSFANAHTGNDSSNQDMQKATTALKKVARTTNTAGICVHHMGKGNSEHPRVGADRLRGASTLRAMFGDVIGVEPQRIVSGRPPRSLVSFDKMRNQLPPESFMLHILRDVDMFRPNGFKFEFGPVKTDPTPEEKAAAEMRKAILQVKTELRKAEAFTEDAAVERSVLMFAMKAAHDWPPHQFKKMIGRITEDKNIHELTGFAKEKRYYTDKIEDMEPVE